MTHYVHDYETLANCFVGVFEHFKTDEQHIFVVHKLRNDISAVIKFLEQNVAGQQWHISFNGLTFDSQISMWILQNKQKLLKMEGEAAARLIYAYAQSVINKQNRNAFSDYPAWKIKIPQVDIFKLNHWDSKAKVASLKWIQYSMDWPNVEEMPIHHTTEVHTQEEIDLIISYCINDVKSTKAIMNLSKGEIMLRKSLTEEYGINLYCASEPRISKELFAHFLAEEMGIEKKELKQMRTHRGKIRMADIILPYVSFTNFEFQSVLHWYKNLEVDFSYKQDTDDKYKYSIRYKGVATDYGLGGLHGATKPGIYEAKPGFIIMTSDVKSFYPNLAIKNGFHPAHLPKEIFLGKYEGWYNDRQVIPKSNPKNYVYKIILNATYGLSKDENCFLYDPLFTMQITINGQLLLSMLYEQLGEAIPESIPLMQNTDGLEMMIPESAREKYLEVCAEWEKLTKLELEHDEYRKMIIADVNNYIAIPKKGDIKCKGRFEWEALEKKKVSSLHKNKSFLIIPKAIYEYFVNGIAPEDYLEQNKNIFDYCGGLKARGEWEFVIPKLVGSELAYDHLQKTVRYFISKEGVKIMKRNKEDKRTHQVEAGHWKQTICNNIDLLPKDFDSLDIDKKYYLDKIYKEINNIDKIVSAGTIQIELDF